MHDLFQNHAAKSGPVECLGQTFPSDEACREHYLKLLAEKLKDPAFRKIEGFPIGSDEAILALSDPPYYTACPNPFVGDFVRHHGTPYDSSISSKEPFASDVSEGKNDPIYNAHSYHTKVPHKAIMRYLLHYTQPGDVVLDSFCGTGMTGVATQLCGDRSTVESLGYRVESDGAILEPRTDLGRTNWRHFSRLGARLAVLNDLSPAATSIANNYNHPEEFDYFEENASRIYRHVEASLGWMFETLHEPTLEVESIAVQSLRRDVRIDLSGFGVVGKINYTIWSDVFACSECAGEIVYWDASVDAAAGALRESFACIHCGATQSKRTMERIWVSSIDQLTGEPSRQAKQLPVEINYAVGSKSYAKKPSRFDLAVLDLVNAEPIPEWCPTDELPFGFNTRQPKESHGLTRVHHFYTRRNLIVLCTLYAAARTSGSKLLEDVVNNMLTRANKQSSLHVQKYFHGGGGVCKGHLTGTLYIPSLSPEIPATKIFNDRIRTFKRWLATYRPRGKNLISTGSAASLGIEDSSIDYIFVDPPFGRNIMYSEVNFIDEAWHRVFTNNGPEAIESGAQNKTLTDYRTLMCAAFKEAYRALKPGRWMTVEFSNTQAAVWNAIQTALQEAGFVVANVSALDKKQGSFKAMTTTTAVKQDLVISAYKPNGGLEDRFADNGGTEDSVWDFVDTHLRYLPVVKVNNGVLEFIAERDPRIIFDRMVAWFFGHGVPVPMSTQEFQSGLMQRFVERDGMTFLSDQVTEYDKKRLQVAIAPQIEMFVSDERSAIDWLTDFLKRRPSTYQEVHTDFISQLGAGWRKHELKPELAALLEDNFIQYDGTGEVPSQIHSYLSTNHKDLRGLEKSSPALVAKAMDRWYVPDPNKAQDLEKKREKALLKEFHHYRAFTGRRLKEFRLEALRAGFRAAWGNKDYQTIIDIAKKVPDEALQEDEKLLTLYDLALTRTQDGI
jgi:DNA modification methylase